MIKRGFDFIFSAIGIIITSPVFILTSIWIKMDSKGPIFYRGVRVGRDVKLFNIFKFRSMVIDQEGSGVTSTSSNDSRITSSGHFIRKWKLDELAQLLNVLKGDMSLVGPRPEVQEFVNLYTEEEKSLLKLRPGITDWASIWNSDEGGVLEGAIDADAVYMEVIRPVKLELQLYYHATRTFYKDIKILFFTVYKVINGSFVPAEISSFPGFDELRQQAVEVIRIQREKG